MAKAGTKEYIPAHIRKEIPDEDFAGPHKSFPIRNQDDVNNAARLIGHADDPEAVKAAIIRIAKKKGLSIPDAWKSGSSDKKESLAESSTFTPKSRVATFKTKFLSDGAQSRNRRVYPQEAVDKLVRSGQLALETPGSDPLTCYISHGEADNDNSLKLAGKITKVYKQGSDAWATIEMPDTTTGREAATLAKHGFLKTSLRATGAELRMSKSGGMPEVSGEGLRLLGIDFTTTPGIETVTVEDVTLESVNASTPAQDINEIFEMPADSLLLEEVEEVAPPMINIHVNPDLDIEEITREVNKHLSFQLRNRIGTQKFEMTEEASNAHDLLIANKSSLQAIHDHIASVQGRNCVSSSMENTIEAGRRLSQATMQQLDQAHDKTAEVLGIECGGSSSSASGDDNMGDGDDDDGNNMQSHSDSDSHTEHNQSLDNSQEENNMAMTLEEARKLLEEAGHTVQPPKTEAEKIQEAIDAKLAAMQESFDAKLTEATKQLIGANTPKPQRQSLVEGSNVNAQANQSNPKIYRKGSYLQEQLKGLDWAQLADKTMPLPDGVNPEYLLAEFGHLYLMKTGYYDEA